MSPERKKKELQKELGIEFKTIILPDQWPAHLFNTFQQVRSFKKFDISTFPKGDDFSSPDQLLWRGETTNRAREIAKIAATLIEDAPVEMDTRLRLEQHVLLRFYLATDCITCRERLWRSEVEAVVESPGTIHSNLIIRRGDRKPCQCPEALRLSNLKETNAMFSTRADEMMSFDFSENRSENLKNRRPDRILGFQETNSLSRRLAQFDLMAGQLQVDPELRTLWETVESTVLTHKGNALLFPFLVIEAKSRYGDSFDACDIQTAQPILKMLRVQEDLQAKSQMRLEYGGPLLWYIAYRGEDWRISACYISTRVDKHLCEVVNLWSGQLNDGDSTLQLLLIIDYIYDWARDVFRPSIISQLAKLASPAQDEDRLHDNGFTTADTDSDIFSLGREYQRKRNDQRNDIEAWDATVEDPAAAMLEEELSLIKWATCDSPIGIFRPARIVESLFRCLYVTKENVETLFSNIPKGRSPKILARNAENVLNVNHVLVSEDVLGRMEELWTNRARPQQRQDVPEKRFFATINYCVSSAENWELRRVLACLAFDEESLNLLRQYHGRKSIPVAIKRAKILRKDNVEALLTGLKNQSVQQNLASALASQMQELRPVAGASSSSICPTFEFADHKKHWIDDRGSQWRSDATASEVIDQVHAWCKKGSEEPMQPYARFSQQMSSLIDDPADSTVSGHFLDCETLQDEQYVLAARYSYDSSSYFWKSTLHLCLYALPGPLDPPSTELLDQVFQRLLKNGLIYLINSKPNAWTDTCKSLRTGIQGEELSKTVQLWHSEIQEKSTSRKPVTPSALRIDPFQRHSRSLSPSPSTGFTSPSSYIPPLVDSSPSLKRPIEAEDGDEIRESKKKFRASNDCSTQNIIVIDD